MMKKKILFVITKPNWGGAQRYVHDLATTLPKDHYEVSLVTGSEGELTKRLLARGITPILVPSLKRDISLFDEFDAYRDLVRIFKEERPDIVHLNSSKAGALGALAARAAGVRRIIFTAHGWPFGESRNIFWKLFAWAGSVATGMFADVVIAVSAKDRRMSPVPWKTVLIRNGIPPADPMARDAARAEIDLRARIDIPKDVPWVGAIAELTANKGLRYLIEAAKEYPRTAFVIVGDGELRLELEAIARKARVADRIFFAGAMADAGRLISAFDVFVLPSLKEGLPYVVLEAMAAGVPVIATRVGGVPEEVENERSGLLVPRKDSKALAKALGRVIDDPALSGKFTDAARKHLAEHFGFERMITETEKAYGE